MHGQETRTVREAAWITAAERIDLRRRELDVAHPEARRRPRDTDPLRDLSDRATLSRTQSPRFQSLCRFHTWQRTGGPGRTPPRRGVTRAGGGNRTRIIGLETRGFAIKLRPRVGHTVALEAPDTPPAPCATVLVGAGRLELPAFASQTRCSTRLSYAPLALIRAYRMAVCADELALLHLGTGLDRPPSLDQRADVRDLLAAWKGVPGHGGWMEDAAAISAGRRALEAIVPLREATTALLHLLQTTGPVAEVVLPVVRTSAVLAPQLPTVAS